MRQVVLSVLEGKNFVLGTFDTTNLKEWWKSESFPGAIDIIYKPIHVYGQYHCCIVKMLNGTYSIYRTKNMGKSWTSVYNTSDKIFTLTTIDYGWIIGSTSSGWIESKLDSGYTWTEISAFAPGCKTVINIGDDILFAHDGTKIWRSTDMAKTWSVVLDKNRWLSKPLHPEWSSCYFSFTGVVEPVLAGINSTIFAGFGPYLVISDDNGDTWMTHIAAWVNNIYNDPRWGNLDNNTILNFNPNQRILQLIVTKGNGLPTTSCELMIRLLVGSTVYYRHSARYNQYTAGSYWQTVFSKPYKGLSGEIISSDVQLPSSSLRNLFTSINTYDNNNNPIIMYSINGGSIWTKIDTSQVTVYTGDPAQEIFSPSGQQVFDEEFWTTYSWVGDACHNSGKYLIDYNKTIRGISFDTDFLTTFRKTFAKSHDILIKNIFYKTLSMDITPKISFHKTYLIDNLVLKNDIGKVYYKDLCLKDSFISTTDFDIASAIRPIIQYSFDINTMKIVITELYPKMYLNDINDKTYGMGMKLIDNHVDQIMNSIERYTTQPPDIRYPNIPYNVWDSRKEGVTL